MWTIGLRLIPIFAFVVGLGTAFGIFLDYSALRSGYTVSVRERLQVVADGIGTSVEALVSLGQPLTGQTAVQETIEREAVLFGHGLRSIDVVEGGLITLSSDIALIGRPASADPLDMLVERPITNAIGKVAATIAVRYDRSQINATLDEMAAELTLRALPALVLAALGAIGSGLLFSVWLRRIMRRTVAQQTMPQPTRRALYVIDRLQSAIERTLSKAPARDHQA